MEKLSADLLLKSRSFDRPEKMQIFVKLCSELLAQLRRDSKLIGKKRSTYPDKSLTSREQPEFGEMGSL